MEIQEFDPNVRYPKLLDAYRRALETAPDLKFTEFCRDNDVTSVAFTHWLNRRGMTVGGIRSEVRRSLGLDCPQVAPKYEGMKPSELYMAIWTDFKSALQLDRSLSLTHFCKSCGVSARRMEKWMRRHNVSVMDAKMEAAGDDCGLVLMNETLRKRFRQVLDKYKELLACDLSFSLKDHCANMHTDYHQFIRWMRNNGITTGMVKKAVKSRLALGKPNRQVQLQFTPNGSSATGKLRSVTVRLPDGSCVMMDECTVVELCAFVVAFNQSHK